jgi:integrase
LVLQIRRRERGEAREEGLPRQRRATEELARAAEAEAARIKAGLLDPKELERREHAARPVAEHVKAFGDHLAAKGSTPKHVALTLQQARRVIELVAAGRLPDLSGDRVQDALKALREEGLSLGTVNSHRTSIRSFSKWAWKSGRLSSDVLAGVSGYNAKEDRRHDRRTLAIDELRRLIEAAHVGPTWREMTGPARALCYRLAVTTGLRYGEIKSITPESFDWTAAPPTVTAAAAYTKNGDPATLPLPRDLADDLRAHAEAIPRGSPVFALTDDRGAAMLRADLARAGIPYRDANGLVYDFHALRCQLATNADAAGVSPRVVQKLMRHSTLELTGRYTRPRADDLTAAALSLPSLAPGRPSSHAAGGPADGQPMSEDLSHCFPTAGDASGGAGSHPDVMAGSNA